MTPELPMTIPAGAAITEITWPSLECSMLRIDVRCNNPAQSVIIFPLGIGYQVIAFCQHCFDTRSDGWMESLEAQSDATLFRGAQ
jgi:hypothetical protein